MPNHTQMYEPPTKCILLMFNIDRQIWMQPKCIIINNIIIDLVLEYVSTYFHIPAYVPETWVRIWLGSFFQSLLSIVSCLSSEY